MNFKINPNRSPNLAVGLNAAEYVTNPWPRPGDEEADVELEIRAATGAVRDAQHTHEPVRPVGEGLADELMPQRVPDRAQRTQPLAYNWNRMILGGPYGNSTAAFEAVGIVNLLTDFFIIILSMPVLWNLQLPIGKKIGLTATFGIRIVICVISAIRIVSLADFSDFSYGIGNVAYWSLLEPGFGVICRCIPVLQPVVSKFGRSTLWSRRHPGQSDDKTPGNSNSRDLEGGRGGKFQRMDDGLYSLTIMSTENESEPGVETVAQHTAQKSMGGRRISDQRIMITHDYTVEHH